MRFFDLHCDTLYEAVNHNKSFYNNNLHVSFSKGKNYKNWFECFAIWIPDDISGEESKHLFEKAYKKFISEIDDNKNNVKHCKTNKDIINAFNEQKTGAVFTVEGSNACNKNINYLYKMKEYGVKVITLTWNGKSYVGDGSGVENPMGLTDFGIEFIKKINELNIIADISHASDKLFYDVANLSSKPIIATHSNSRKICNHKRNLTDEQFKIIKNKKGIVGINFCKYFLNASGNANFSDVLKHIEHFLSIGGEKIVCIGSDFDGTDMPEGISGVESIENLYEYFLKKNYKENLLNDIFFSNAYNFALNNF